MWAAGIALRFRSLQAGPLMQTPVFLILFLAPVYVPLSCCTAGSRRWRASIRSPRSSRRRRSLIAGELGRVGVAALIGAALVDFLPRLGMTGMKRAEASGLAASGRFEHSRRQGVAPGSSLKLWGPAHWIPSRFEHLGRRRSM